MGGAQAADRVSDMYMSAPLVRRRQICDMFSFLTVARLFYSVRYRSGPQVDYNLTWDKNTGQFGSVWSFRSLQHASCSTHMCS